MTIALATELPRFREKESNLRHIALAIYLSRQQHTGSYYSCTAGLLEALTRVSRVGYTPCSSHWEYLCLLLTSSKPNCLHHHRLGLFFMLVGDLCYRHRPVNLRIESQMITQSLRLADRQLSEFILGDQATLPQ
jgi:hypothetical protein